MFPEKNGTAQSILDEAKRDFKFSENGTGQLRLVHVGTGSNCHRVFQEIKRDMSMAEIRAKYTGNTFMQLRVEEVPADQLEQARDERLFPVAHYDKEPNRMHGIPFFLKIHDGEPIVNIRRRIRELLEVPEREFEKVRSCCASGGAGRGISQEKGSGIRSRQLASGTGVYKESGALA